jgi:acyl-homoserine-lactone acylase
MKKRNVMKRCSVLVLLTALVIGPSDLGAQAADTSFSSTDVQAANLRYPAETWMRYARPEEAGWSSDGIAEAMAFADSIGSAAFMLVHDGVVVATFGDYARRYQLHSVRKSLLSGLFGPYVAEGRIDLESTLADLGIDDREPLSPTEKTATVRDLLRARSGVYHPAAYWSSGMASSRPERGSHEPGAFWYYNNWDFNTLGEIFRRRTGEDLFDAFARRIADPLRMEDFRRRDGYYHFEREHSNFPAYPFRMSARDMARFGLLFEREGQWEGKEIIPASWIRESTRSHSGVDRPGLDGYGYMWSVLGGELSEYGGYTAIGVGTQTITVIPDLDLVFVHRVDTYTGGRVPLDDVLDLLELLVRARRGEPVAQPDLIPLDDPQPDTHFASVPDELLQRYARTYTYPSGRTVEVSIQSGQLVSHADRLGTFGLLPITERQFLVEDARVSAFFVPLASDDSVLFVQEMILRSEAATLLTQGRMEEAVDILERVVEYYPASADARRDLARALRVSGDTAAAASSYRRSLELDPGDVATEWSLVQLRAEGFEPIQPKPDDLEQYVGRYRIREGVGLTISREGDQLLVRPPGDTTPQPLTAINDTTFFAELAQGPVKLVFTRHGSDRASAVSVSLPNGQQLRAELVTPSEHVPAERAADTLASQVTIYRDAYGIPHVHGETDAAAVFGYMYAQAEDALDGVEREVARMVGRLTEIEGEAALSSDLYVRSLETERLSRAEYDRASPEFRAIADAWAAGLNHYLERHPEVVPRVIRRFDPWQMFAVAGRSESIWVPSAHGLLETSEVARAVDAVEAGRGSNMWMIGPGKSATGRAMIFINPHNPPETYLEGHLLSDDGLNVYGGHRPGRPFPVFGHTSRHGWAMTNNAPDVVDLWRETFDHPTNPLAYRYGDGYRIAEEWTETVRVRTDLGLAAREVTFRKTHHGPIVAVRDGVPLALRIARWEEGGTVQQFHAMARARSFEEFRDAVGRLREIWLSIGYADAEGNIWYVHNGAVPRRSLDFDWSEPVDGSDPRTEWQGYHELDEVPQVLNPESGWLMNTNHSPFRVTAEGENPHPADYPSYMVQPHFGLGRAVSGLFDSLGDNARSRASRRILGGQERFTFEEWAEASMSKRAWEADADIPALVAAWQRLHATDPARAARLGPAVETLRAWDRVSRHESVGMTLYTLLKMTQAWSWIASLEDPPFDPPAAMEIEPTPRDRWDHLAGLEKVMGLLERDWGTWSVPYGELSRLQRSPDGRYTDERPSVPVLGGFPEAGMIQLFILYPIADQKRWYGFVSGNSYVSVVEFGGDGVRARSVNGSGQSTDPASPHYTDQAGLYGRGEYKPVWTTLEEVRANAVRSYRPGDRAGNRPRRGQRRPEG